MIRFFLLTGKEFASLEAPDPEAIYFIRDEHRIQTAGVDFCSGVSGFGISVPASAASDRLPEDMPPRYRPTPTPEMPSR